MKYVLPFCALLPLTLLRCAFGTPPAAGDGGDPQYQDGTRPQEKGLPGKDGAPPKKDKGVPTPPDKAVPSDKPVKLDKGVPPKLDKGVPPKLDKGVPPKLDKGVPPKLDKGVPPKLDTGVPPKLDTGPTKPKTIFFDSFEIKNTVWKTSGDWEQGQLAFQPDQFCDSHSTMSAPVKAFAGKGVMATRVNGCYRPLGNSANSCANVNPADDSILRLDIQIPAGYKKATLGYREWADYFRNYDWAEIRINGKVVMQDCTGGHKKPTAWIYKTVDLSPYIGQMVGIEFHFMASGVVNLSGWYLDIVSITVQ